MDAASECNDDRTVVKLAPRMRQHALICQKGEKQ